MKPATLNDMLPLEKGDVEEAWARAREESPKLAKATGGMAGAVAGILVGELRGVLNTEIYSLLAHLWVLYEKVKATAVESRAKPADLLPVNLMQHEFTHTVHPTVTFYVGNDPVSELRFDLELEANIRSVMLGIRNASIESVSAASGLVAVRLKYGKVKVKEAKTREIQLTEHFPLRKPVAVFDTRPA